MAMNFERRDIDTAPEIRMDAGETKITGYAAVFNEVSKDVGGFVEKVRPGSFKRVLSRGDNVLGLFNHDMDNLLASVSSGSLRLSEDNVGLKYEFDLDASDPDHQRVISKVRRRDLRGSSWAFRTSPGTDVWTATSDGMPMREVTEVSALRDVGPVTSPAYPSTESGGAALALRSLADLVNKPVEELVEHQAELAAFLLELRSTDEQPEEATIPDEHLDADSRKDADSNGEVKPIPRPRDDPAWVNDFVRSTHGS
jgi:hypothetical protein